MTTRDQGTQTASDVSQPQYQDEGVPANIETDESVMVSVTVKNISGGGNKRKRLSVRLVVHEDSECHPARRKRKDA